MSEEYRKGYRDGFEDGYEKAKRDLQKTPNPLFPSQPMQYEPRCPVCGMRWDNPMGYVCMNEKCPTKISCGTGTISTTFGTKNWEDTVKKYNNTWVDCDSGC